MLDTKELRIGNFVCYFSDKILKINDGKDIDLLLEEGKNAMPIALDEDILLKCGFALSGKEETISYFRHLDTTIRIVKERDEYSFRYTDKIGDFILRNNVIVIVNYLHQLQNLHYFITGQELDVRI